MILALDTVDIDNDIADEDEDDYVYVEGDNEMHRSCVQRLVADPRNRCCRR